MAEATADVRVYPDPRTLARALQEIVRKVPVADHKQAAKMLRDQPAA